MSKQIGFGQSLKISPPPPDNTTYALKILPYPDLGCVDTVYTIVKEINEGFKLNVLDTIHQCPHTVVDLTAAAVTAGSSPGMTLSYYTDSLATSYLYHPDSVTTPGVYYIQGINTEGCMNVLPVHIVMSPATITVTDPAPIDFPGTVDLSKSFIPASGQTYGYYTDAKATNPLKNYTAIGYDGRFYIKAVNKFGCDTIAPVNVEIDPPPPYVITAPNTFTPNNDGVNDYFSVSVKGIVTFGSVSIYNRYGQLMFMTKSADEQWDGKYNGAKLPDGTYYWIFEGEDIYYKKKINRAGSITIVR
jgi:gliding motility-associated-like protein